jgi:DNA topoisomerase IB
LLYDNQPVALTPEQEEVATFYAQYLKTDHAKNEVRGNACMAYLLTQ